MRVSDMDESPPRKSKSKHKKDKNHYNSKSHKSKNSHSKDEKTINKYDEFDIIPRKVQISPPHVEHKSKKEEHKHKRRKEKKKSSKSSRESSSESHTSLSRESKSKKSKKESPKRKKRSRWDHESESSTVSSKEKKKHKKMKKTLDGTSAGLQNLQSLKAEIESQKMREDEMFRNMKADVSGRGQSTVVRDRKTGKKRNFDEEAVERREKRRKQDEIDEKYAKWGKGLKQLEDREEKLKQDLYEMQKPLARYADDEDLDRELRKKERDDDPMLKYIKEKECKEGKREPDKPAYQGSFMPNRFGIKPGYRWDGVDRSNGYEKKWFEAKNAKKASEEEAYKWCSEDM